MKHTKRVVTIVCDGCGVEAYSYEGDLDMDIDADSLFNGCREIPVRLEELGYSYAEYTLVLCADCMAERLRKLLHTEGMDGKSRMRYITQCRKVAHLPCSVQDIEDETVMHDKSAEVEDEDEGESEGANSTEIIDPRHFEIDQRYLEEVDQGAAQEPYVEEPPRSRSARLKAK